MCGIIGYIGNDNCVPYLLDGLNRLEYRGYDSSGIVTLSKDGFIVYKDKGMINHLKSLIPSSITSSIGIGHTRWATTGEVSKENAHPHISSNNEIAIVHNGIIENYLELKERYLNNTILHSSTDTEVIANLLEIFIQNDFLKTIKYVSSLLKGSFTLVILYKKEPNKLYFIKNQTPLLIGKSNESIMLSSDILGFSSIKKYIILNDGDYGYVSLNKIKILNSNSELVSYNYHSLNTDSFSYSKAGYPTFMEKEINEEVDLVNIILQTYYLNNKFRFNKEIINKLNHSSRIFIVACGSSYYASLLGQYYLEHHTNKTIITLLASEVIYNLPYLNKDDFFIFVSQSGETLDVINVLKKVKKQNIYTLAITNVSSSTLDFLCDKSIYIYAGREIAVASTKCVLGEILIFYLLSECLNQTINNISITFSRLEDEIRNIINRKEEIISLSNLIISHQKIFFLGRNLDYYIALEGALKLKELTYLNCNAYPSGELKHGPIAMIDKDSLIIGLSTQSNTSSIIRINLKETEVRNGLTYLITSSNLQTKEDDFIFNNINEDLNPIITLIYVQLLSYYTALKKNNNVDKPRNLAKSVTVE